MSKIRHLYQFEVKGKGHSMTCLSWHRGEAEILLQPICNPAIGSGWLASRFACFSPVNDPVPIVEEVVLASRPV
jgi:hypothetical protein